MMAPHCNLDGTCNDNVTKITRDSKLMSSSARAANDDAALSETSSVFYYIKVYIKIMKNVIIDS